MWIIYSRVEVFDLNLKRSVCSSLNRGGTSEVTSNGNIATGSVLGRMLNVVGSWVGIAQGRHHDNAFPVPGIDGGRQSEEECGSGNGFEEHLNNEWMKVRGMAAGSARDRLCRPLRMEEWSVVMNFGRDHS